MRTCDVDGCEDGPRSRGLCSRHYNRWYRTGSADFPAAVDECLECGEPNPPKPPTGPRALYCSRACQARASRIRRAKPPIPGRTCIGCASAFVPMKSRRQVYCTSQCARNTRRAAIRATREPRERLRCGVEGCAEPHHSHGYCNSHRMIVRRFGDPTSRRRVAKPKPPPRDLRSPVRVAFEAGDRQALIAEMLKHTVEAANGCREWARTIDNKGYARVPIGKRHLGAHRVMAEAVYGPLHGEPVHHVCANRKCIEPTHLQPVTQRENVAEMLTRRWLESRIEALEQALSQVAPTHSLLEGLCA